MKFIITLLTLASCDLSPSSDYAMREAQEKQLQEANNSVGAPAIVNWREKRMVKENYELRDQEGLITYTYTFAEYSGKLTFFCNSIGYGIPYATQFSNPEKVTYAGSGITLPQAEPNSLFMPTSAEGTWVQCKVPGVDKVVPVYMEPRVVVVPFELPDAEPAPPPQ
jgi:hypothetical protein